MENMINFQKIGHNYVHLGDIKIEGDIDLTGMQGNAVIIGDVDCRNFTSPVSVQVAGAMTANNIECESCLTVTGNIIARKVKAETIQTEHIRAEEIKACIFTITENFWPSECKRLEVQDIIGEIQSPPVLKTIFLGKYPQTEETLLKDTLLNAIGNSHWNSLSKGKAFIDIEVDGKKYRGLKQKKGGKTEIRWFKFEPIEWDILREENGKKILLSKNILMESDFERACSWLDSEFYENYFSEEEKGKIKRVILPSYKNVTDEELGFTGEAGTCDLLRARGGTDYSALFKIKDEDDDTGEEESYFKYRFYSPWWIQGEMLPDIEGYEPNEEFDNLRLSVNYDWTSNRLSDWVDYLDYDLWMIGKDQIKGIVPMIILE